MPLAATARLKRGGKAERREDTRLGRGRMKRKQAGRREDLLPATRTLEHLDESAQETCLLSAKPLLSCSHRDVKGIRLKPGLGICHPKVGETD